MYRPYCRCRITPAGYTLSATEQAQACDTHSWSEWVISWPIEASARFATNFLIWNTEESARIGTECFMAPSALRSQQPERLPLMHDWLQVENLWVAE